jgi:putative nucleotidyltransferase with HDIG domain
MASFVPPAEHAELLRRIDALAGERGVRANAVGGTVRDALLGRASNDIDVAVEGDALAFARALAEAVDGHFVVLDDEFGIGRVVLRASKDYVDVAGLRGTLEQDLAARDFTIDAMAAPLPGGAIVDPHGGVADLADRRIRMLGADALDSDPLRMLRAVRLAGELGFAIEPATSRAIDARASRIGEAAAERRRDELGRIFALERVEPSLRLLDALGLLDALLPEVTAGRGVTQPENHHAYDVFEHAMHAVAAMDVILPSARPDDARAWMWDEVWRAFAWCEGELRAYLAEPLGEGRTRAAALKLATLLHDVAKPQTRSVESGGRIRFLGHAEEGARVAARVMRRLRFSSAEVAFVQILVRRHMRPVQLAAVGQIPSMRALYRFHRDLGDALPAVLLLALADAAGSQGPLLTSVGWSRHVLYMNSLLVRLSESESIVKPLRLLSGRDIMTEFGIAEGPIIGQLLDELREAEAIGEVQQREQALAFVRARIPGLKGTQADTGA